MGNYRANIHHVKVDVNEDPEITDDCPEPVPHQSCQHGLPRSEFTKDLSDDSMTGSTSNVLDDLPGTSTLLVNGEYELDREKFYIKEV
ncbi:hypothetical protein Anas_14162 [Armadillidium nasatum]|uniref:Uncharacterized protein n=2 Tax=Armadillidium nasatum TaxID=96803 RepID=A0A5N5T586_9CRUS|nr:hypothetical protein Anas_14162 [Armadillidium nasatum]